MLTLSQLLSYYKRKDVQEEMIKNAENREIAIKFGDKGFGKRPDTLKYPNDVIELVKQGATSFHASEELWKNPLRLEPTLKKSDLNEMRLGWDLVLDIDCEFLEYSKIAADLIVKALKHHGIEDVTVKFSGNHGFHLGVPFEAFPENVIDKETKTLFPEAPRAIAFYLQEMIKKHLANEILKIDDINNVIKKTGKTFNDLIKKNVFDPFTILNIDTILISSRHLYRMPYCFNEKSGLISIPIAPDEILSFKKEYAKPESVVVSKLVFLDKSNVKKNQGVKLLRQALDYNVKHEEEVKKKTETDYEDIKEAIPQEFFPPCIKNILKGLDDGKKRSLFVLTNFLVSVGWQYDEIEKLIREWNKRNTEQLRETVIVGQVRYHKQQKKKILPPNCQNAMYYKDMNICAPDNLCNKIKNPVNYSKIKTKFLNKPNKEKQRKGKNEANSKRDIPKP